MEVERKDERREDWREVGDAEKDGVMVEEMERSAEAASAGVNVEAGVVEAVVVGVESNTKEGSES